MLLPSARKPPLALLSVSNSPTVGCVTNLLDAPGVMKELDIVLISLANAASLLMDVLPLPSGSPLTASHSMEDLSLVECS
jgi:hypothetical protein